ncbi:unnamed protein product [Gordionus sp. m RMFG-2023]
MKTTELTLIDTVNIGYNYSIVRLVRQKYTDLMFTVGFCIGPFNHLWYTNLDRWMPGTSRKIILKKLLADQILAAPIFCFIFFMGMGLLEKKRLEPIYSEWVQKFPFIYLMDCIFWPPVQVVNFSYVPTKYRVMYVNSFTLLWDTFLSFSKHTL